jgi:hypothetical protein
MRQANAVSQSHSLISPVGSSERYAYCDCLHFVYSSMALGRIAITG